MQQLFHTRNYAIRDFEEWDKCGELILQPNSNGGTFGATRPPPT